MKKKKFKISNEWSKSPFAKIITKMNAASDFHKCDYFYDIINNCICVYVDWLDYCLSKKFTNLCGAKWLWSCHRDSKKDFIKIYPAT